MWWYVFIVALLLAFVALLIWWNSTKDNTPEIIELTDEWCDAVTTGTPADTANLFCEKSILIGTVSQTIRDTEESIQAYFDYFMGLPGLQILERNYNITRINSTTYVNNAFITWVYDGVEPFVARMTFVYEYTSRKWCLFLLHSSVLPDRVDELFLKK